MKSRHLLRRRREVMFRLTNNVLLKLLVRIYRKYEIESSFSVGREGVFCEREGMRFIYSFVYRGCTGNLDSFGTTEKETRDYLRSRLTDEDVVYDIGAHGGLYSVFVSSAVPRVELHSFEPLAEELNQNLALNGIRSVRVHVVAVGNDSGETRITRDRRSSNFITSQSDRTTQSVPIVRLDDYVRDQNLTLPTLIKLDIEGMEYHALKGAQQILMEARPIVVAEINHSYRRYYTHLSEFLNFMTGLGYVLMALRGTGLQMVQYDEGVTEDTLLSSADSNYWFIPKD